MKRDLTSLKNLIKRGDEVEKNRLRNVKSKEDVLKAFIYRDSQ